MHPRISLPKTSFVWELVASLREKQKPTYLASHVVSIFHGLVDFSLLQIIFGLFTQLFGKILLVFHLH